MRAQFTAGISGLLFGFGLIISGMVNPAKVLNFLDITGQWDPSLAFVMGGALVVTFLGYKWLRGWNWPIVTKQFYWPSATKIDARLVGGSGLFGIGWGLAGLCPGPAITIASIGGTSGLIFLGSMLGTMTLYRFAQSAGLPGTRAS